MTPYFFLESTLTEQRMRGTSRKQSDILLPSKLPALTCKRLPLAEETTASKTGVHGW